MPEPFREIPYVWVLIILYICGHMYKDTATQLTYNSWDGMKARCYNPKTNGYDRYGGRGITVCDRWVNSFDNFLIDMGYRPSKNHSIDRYPDKGGNYEPTNCRWATREEQRINMTKTIVVNYNGEDVPLFILAHKHNISPHLLYRRVIGQGWDIQKALITPKQSTIKWGRFCSKIKYIKSDAIYNTLRYIMISHRVPLAKSTTNGLSKSILYINTAKYRTPDQILYAQYNPASKQIKGTHAVTGEIKLFYGLKDAADYVNGFKSCVANVIGGQAKTYKKWKFEHI